LNAATAAGGTKLSVFWKRPTVGDVTTIDGDVAAIVDAAGPTAGDPAEDDTGVPRADAAVATPDVDVATPDGDVTWESAVVPSSHAALAAANPTTRGTSRA
jgi:hypothetical protein